MGLCTAGNSNSEWSLTALWYVAMAVTMAVSLVLVLEALLLWILLSRSVQGESQAHYSEPWWLVGVEKAAGVG